MTEFNSEDEKGERPNSTNPFKEQLGSNIPEPLAVTYIRNHASFLMTGRLADRLFEAAWFFIGLLANLLVVLPFLLSLGLVLGLHHYYILKTPITSGLCIVLALSSVLLVWHVLGGNRKSLANSVNPLSRILGWLIFAMGISVGVISVSFLIEVLRDQFRFNELTLLSTGTSILGLLSSIGALQNLLASTAIKSAKVLEGIVCVFGAAVVYFSLLLTVNWMVYGNPLEIARWFSSFPTLTGLRLTLWVAGLSLLFLLWALLSNRRDSPFFKYNLIYLLPLIVAALALVFLVRVSTEPVVNEAVLVSGGIGELSRPLGVFDSIEPDGLELTDNTVSVLKRLQKQRDKIRSRQEYVNSSASDDQVEELTESNVKTYGLTQAYVDNAAELLELDDAEKFAVRQSLARKARQALLQRAFLLLGNLSEDFSAPAKWVVAKPVLVEMTALNVLKASKAIQDRKSITEIEEFVLEKLSESRVGSLYQDEFIELFCPTLKGVIPVPTSQNSFFPGTAPLFFDGLDDEPSRTAIRIAIGRHLYRLGGENGTILDKYKTKHPQLHKLIVSEEQVRKKLSSTSSKQLVSKTGLVRCPLETLSSLSNNQTTQINPKVMEKVASPSPNTQQLRSNDDLGKATSPVIRIRRNDKAKDEETIEAEVARKLIIERSVTLADSKNGESAEFLNAIQTPEIGISDDDQSQLNSYGSKGVEKFTSDELLFLAVSPFTGLNSKNPTALNQQMDFVVSTVAFSDYANLEKLSTTRTKAFKQVFAFKCLFVLLSILLIASFAVGFINVNWTSANGYYRSKLLAAFLTSASGDNLDKKFSELRNPQSLAPYLIVNTVANLQGSEDLSLRDRKCDLFMFSPIFSGSRKSAYIRTTRLELADPNLKLSTAVTISAAAISPNMGRLTNPLLVWLMSLLNVRLGYWLPNPQQLGKTIPLASIKKVELQQYLAPRRIAFQSETQSGADLRLTGLALPGGGIRSATFNLGIIQALTEADAMPLFDYLSTVSGGGYIGSSLVAYMNQTVKSTSVVTSERGKSRRKIAESKGQSLAWQPPPALLFKEMFSVLREDDAWLNLSDGGHVENLATFELFERRCGLIVVGNAEADTSNTNGGIGISLRMVKTDLGINVDIDLSAFDLDEDLNCQSHWAAGRIYYPKTDELPASTGILVILRASITGDEEAGIKEYRERIAVFPYEPTTDQF